MGCTGCIGGMTKKAFEGLPYESRWYYLADAARHVGAVTQEVTRCLGQGIQGVDISSWQITMSKLFSETRSYLLVKYEGVNLYLLVYAFGTDLYVSWITLFKLGCLQRLMRFGNASPTDLDVDDLEMLGRGVDLYLREILDRVLRGEGLSAREAESILSKSKRKRFVKA